MAVLSFRRKVTILGVCIALLAAAYVLGLVFSPARVGKREAESPLVEGFKRQVSDQVAEIRLTSGNGSLILVKSAEQWTLPGPDRDYPASATRIDTFLGFLADVAKTRVVTDNPDSWEEFQVHAGSDRRIQLFDSSGVELLEIIIGKSSAGGGDDYLRLGSSNEVILSNRSFDYYLNVEQEFWSYLRIFPEDLEGQSVMRITVESRLQFGAEPAEDLDYTLVLSSEQPAVWKLVDRETGELDNKQVDLLAGNIADLEGTRFAIADPEQTGLSSPAARVLISTIDDRDFRLRIGSRTGEDQYYASLENGELVYEVSEWRIKGILKSVEQLLPKQADVSE